MIDIKNVIEVGKERIKYRDAEGNIAFVELAASANVWAHRHSDVEQAEKRICADKYTDKNSIYLEFYNIGHAKIGVKASLIGRVFGKGVSARQMGKLENFQKKLCANGWNVYKV